MKKYIVILILLVSSTITAQTIKPVEDYYASNFNDLDNVYFKDVNYIYDKFLGTWEYTNNLHYLKVVITKLTKLNTTYPNGQRQFRDVLVVDYFYKYNGVVIYNTISTNNLNSYTRYNYIDGHIVKNINTVNLHYNEPSGTSCMRTKNAEINLTYLLTLASQPKKLKWERIDWRETQGIGCPTDDYDTSDFKIPANMILTKIN